MFKIKVVPEKVPSFCKACGTISHILVYYQTLNKVVDSKKRNQMRKEVPANTAEPTDIQGMEESEKEGSLVVHDQAEKVDAPIVSQDDVGNSDIQKRDEDLPPEIERVDVPAVDPYEVPTVVQVAPAIPQGVLEVAWQGSPTVPTEVPDMDCDSPYESMGSIGMFRDRVQSIQKGLSISDAWDLVEQSVGNKSMIWVESSASGTEPANPTVAMGLSEGSGLHR